MVLDPVSPRQGHPYLIQCPRCRELLRMQGRLLPAERRNALLDHALQLDHTLSELTTQVHHLKACIEEMPS